MIRFGCSSLEGKKILRKMDCLYVCELLRGRDHILSYGSVAPCTVPDTQEMFAEMQRWKELKGKRMPQTLWWNRNIIIIFFFGDGAGGRYIIRNEMTTWNRIKPTSTKWWHTHNFLLHNNAAFCFRQTWKSSKALQLACKYSDIPDSANGQAEECLGNSFE